MKGLRLTHCRLEIYMSVSMVVQEVEERQIVGWRGY